MSLVYVIKSIVVKQCFVHFDASCLKSKITVLYMFLQNFIIFYWFIQMFYDNNQGGPVIMKHHLSSVSAHTVSSKAAKLAG